MNIRNKVLPYAAVILATIGVSDYMTDGSITKRFGTKDTHQQEIEEMARENLVSQTINLIFESPQYNIPLVRYVVGEKPLNTLKIEELDRIMTLYLMSFNGEEHKRYSRNPDALRDYEKYLRFKKSII